MIHEVELTLTPEDILCASVYKEIASRKTKIPLDEIEAVVPLRRSLDARKHPAVFRVRTQLYTHPDKPIERDFYAEIIQRLEQFPIQPEALPVVVVGAGPAGIFAALKLLQKGIRPIIVEQGKDVDRRKQDISAIPREKEINPRSNWNFGEGGAGTFSDGKLYTRSSKRGNVQEILEVLVAHGANPEILLEAHPHIGTDKLPSIMIAIRKTIETYGGSYLFDTRMSDLVVEGGQVKGVVTEEENTIACRAVILATGHSARDIYELFAKREWAIEAKPFALGVRVEHPQALINQIQYRSKRYSSALPAATYSLVAKTRFDKSVFSFCMCPGGTIVPSATNNGEIVPNGMSNSKRNSPFANAGIVVGIEPTDIPDFMQQYGALGLMKFQEHVEQSMGRLSETSQVAPAQRLEDFVQGKSSSALNRSSYQSGLFATPLHEILPTAIVQPLQHGFRSFEHKMHGFRTNQANILAVESRTSSPVRIPRDRESLEHIQLKGLYPCGEGAGYAGGITSSAMDGVACAESIAQQLSA